MRSISATAVVLWTAVVLGVNAQPYGQGQGRPYGGGGNGGGGGGYQPRPRPPPQEDCDCDSYLKAYGWIYLKKYGIVPSEFCCLVGFAKQCYDKWSYHKYGKGPVKGIVEVEEDSGITSIKSSAEAWSYCIEYAGLAKLAHKFPDGYGKGIQSWPNPEEQQKNLAGSDYYKPSCKSASSYYYYVACIFKEYFNEALKACYCEFRSTENCNYKDCDDNKSLYIDIYIADDPWTACNQCPDKDDDDVKEPGGYPAPYGGWGNYGYGAYTNDGTPHFECLGYCVLTHVYRTYGYDYYYYGL